MMAYTGAVSGIQPFQGGLEDVTNFAHIYLREHSFKVMEAGETKAD